MPSGSPFKNMHATFHGAGISAKASSAAQAIMISTMMAPARLAGSNSEITLMPIIFDSAYPATCAITRAIL